MQKKVFDNVINLIKIYENNINGNIDKLWWIVEKDDNGYYPDKIYGKVLL